MNDDDGWAMVSELAVDPAHASTLEESFRHRLGEVEGADGFRRLEVWRDPRTAGRYLMVSWWATRENCADWLHSASHDRSHARIPTGEAAPRAVRFDRYVVVAR